MSNRLIGAIRAIALLTVVGLIAALSAGVITTDAQPAFRLRAAPSTQRFGPESFYGNVVAGSVVTIAGVTQFTVDRPKKVGADIDPTQRETINCRLENVPPDQAALVAPGQQLYFYGAYDFVLNAFFVNIVGTTPESVAVAAAPANGAIDNGSDDDDDDNDSDDLDNDSDDLDNGDSSDNDDDDSDNDDDSSDNDDDEDSDNDEDDSDNDDDEDSDNDEDDSDNDEDGENGDDDSDNDDDEDDDDNDADDDEDNDDDEDEDEDNDEDD